MDNSDPMVLESRLPYPKTLDKSVLMARAQEVLLPENAMHENVVDAASGYMQVTGSGGLEAAPFDVSRSIELDTTSEHIDGAKILSAQDQGPTLTKPDLEGWLVVEQQHVGSYNSSPLTSPGGGTDGGAKMKVGDEKKRKRCSKKSPAGGTDGGAKVKAGDQKKRKRCSKKSPAGGADGGAKWEAAGEKKRKNWSDEETEILLKAVPQKAKFRSRIDKFSGSELPSWEGIAEAVPGRTEVECKRRMDTLTKSYNAIKGYCDEQKIEFSHLNEEDFGVIRAMPLKLATRLERSWYNYLRDYCPPRAYKKLTLAGAGSALENGVDSVSCALTLGRRSSGPSATSLSIGTFRECGPVRVEFQNFDVESIKVVRTAPDQVIQSKPRLEALKIVVLPDPERHQHPRHEEKHVGYTPDTPLPAGDGATPTSPAHLHESHCGAEAGLPCLAQPHEAGWDEVDASHVPARTDFDDLIGFNDVPDSQDLFDFQEPSSARNLHDMDRLFYELQFARLPGF